MNDVWNKLCRACLTTKESFSYFLFDSVSAETYTFCTSVEVTKDEDLPKALCDICFELLTKYSQFKRSCIESQNTLLLYSKDVKAEQIQTHNDDALNSVIEIQNDFETKCENLDLKEDLSEVFDTDLLPPEEYPDDDSINVPIKKQKAKKSRKPTIVDNSISESVKKQQHYTCKMCGKKFKYSKILEAHKRDHFVGGNGDDDADDNDYDPTFHCRKCDKTFLTASGLRRHEESTHTAIHLSSVACARCGRVCASKHSLRAHEKMHGSKRIQFVCHVCGKRVSSAVILRAHLETHQVDRERRHTCEHCGKKFFTNTILLSHIKRLHSGLRYICGVCGYPFTDKYNLAKHLLIHDGKKLFNCDICNKSYATNGSLVEHKRIHSGERPFLCTFCPKSFLSKRRLMDHHRIHTGDKPHRCLVCEQRFTQRGTLKRHMKVHDPMKASPHLT